MHDMYKGKETRRPTARRRPPSLLFVQVGLPRKVHNEGEGGVRDVHKSRLLPFFHFFVNQWASYVVYATTAQSVGTLSNFPALLPAKTKGKGA